MNLKVFLLTLFVVGCACAIPLDGDADKAELVSDSLVPAEDNSKKPTRRDTPAKLNGTSSTDAGKNESISTADKTKHFSGRATAEEITMHHGIMHKSQHTMEKSTGEMKEGTHHEMKEGTHHEMKEGTHHEMKEGTHHEMMDTKKHNMDAMEAAIKKRAIDEASKDKKSDLSLAEGTDKLTESVSSEPATTTTPASISINDTIPEQNDSAVMEQIISLGLLDESIPPTEPTKIELARDAEKITTENSTALAGNSTTSAKTNKTANAENKKDVPRHANAGKKDCDDSTHGHGKVERDAKPSTNSTTSKNETLPAKPAASRRRRDAYAPSQIRLAVRNKPYEEAPVRSADYEAPAVPAVRTIHKASRSSYSKAAPIRHAVRTSSYEAEPLPPPPAAPVAVESAYEEAPVAVLATPAIVRTAHRSSYSRALVPSVRTAVRSTYEAPAPVVRSTYEAPAPAPVVRSTYEAPAPAPVVRSTYKAAAPAPVVRSTHKAPAPAPVVRATYEEPAPAPVVRSTYEAPAPAPVVRSTYEAPAPVVRSTYEAPAPAPVVRSAYEAPAPAPVVRSAYEAPAPAPVVRSAYEASAPAPVVRATYEAPAPAPVVRATYEAPAPAPVVRSTYEAPAPVVRSTYEAPAPAPAVRSSYGAPAVRVKSAHKARTVVPVRSSYSRAAAIPVRSTYEAPVVAHEEIVVADSGY